MKPVITLFLFGILSIQSSKACEPLTRLCTALKDTNATIMRCEIIGWINDGVQLKVTEVLSGDETRDTINVLNGTPFDCNGPFPTSAGALVVYPIGNLGNNSAAYDVLISFRKIDTIINSWDVIGDYSFSYTRFFIIDENDSIRISSISNVKLHYQQIKNNMEYLSDCNADVSVLGIKDHLKCDLTINTYPNPSSGLFTIESNLEKNKKVSYRVYGINGTLIQQGLIIKQRTKIDLSNKVKGVYLMEVISEEGVIRKKILLQ